MEIRRANEILLKRLIDTSLSKKSSINYNTNATRINQKKLPYSQRENFIKIAQDNEKFCQRLSERTPYYNAKKLEREYSMNMYYKQNICEYPTVDFSKGKNILSRSSEDIYITHSPPQKKFYPLPRLNSTLNISNSNLQNSSCFSGRNRIFNNDTFAPGTNNNLSNLNQVEIFGLGVCNVEINFEEFK